MLRSSKESFTFVNSKKKAQKGEKWTYDRNERPHQTDYGVATHDPTSVR